jgi:hypothetical protein
MSKSNLLKAVFGFALLCTLSCTRSPDTRLTIQLPEAVPLSKGTVAAQAVSPPIGEISADSPWNGASVNAASEVNCYLVAVSGPEPVLKRNTCTLLGKVQPLKFGPYVGGVPAGSTIELNVLSGAERTIYLFGMKADEGYCRDFSINGPVKYKVSYPRLLATKTTNLSAGKNQIVLKMPSDNEIPNFDQLDNCEMADSRGNGSTPEDMKVYLFGDGRDGNIELTAATGNLSPGGSLNVYNYHEVGGNPQPGLKTISTSKQVVGVSPTDGRVLILKDGYVANEFNLRDEVMWYVSEGWAQDAPDDKACGEGSRLFRGLFGFSRVVDVDTSGSGDAPITLADPITPFPDRVATSNLTATADSSTLHCRIQLIRVPNFNEIKVSYGSSFEALPYNAATGTGGIAVFRAQKIILDSTFSIETSGMGYQGSVGAAGASVEGLAPPSLTDGSANGSGGGTLNGLKGGGGGNAGNGGSAVSNYAAGGSTVRYCLDPITGSNGGVCLPGSQHKAFFGGAGGGDSSAGGAGGGFIFVKAYEVTGSSMLSLRATGTSVSAPDSDAGAGAGGSVHLASAKVGSSVKIEMFANGGSNAGTKGGAGGGGVYEWNYCSSKVDATTVNYFDNHSSAVGGTASGGSDGSDGVGEGHNVPALCGL